MNDQFEGEKVRADAERSSTSVMRLVGQMFMLPFTVFVYGMEIFVRTIQGMQRVADEGLDIVAGGTAQTRLGFPSGGDRSTEQMGKTGHSSQPGPQQGTWGDLKVQTETSTSVSTVGDAAEANQKEIVKMPDKNLSDDQLKLVRYKILFVKYDYETAFPEREELVYDNMTGEAFTAWKVAEFIQNLDREIVPYDWKQKDYPRVFTENEKDPGNRNVFIQRLDERDKKYLRVYYEVLDRYVREEDEDDEVTVLKDIRKAIDRLPRIEDGPGAYVVRAEGREGREREGRRRTEPGTTE